MTTFGILFFSFPFHGIMGLVIVEVEIQPVIDISGYFVVTPECKKVWARCSHDRFLPPMTNPILLGVNC